MPKVKPSDVQPIDPQTSGKVNPSDVTPVEGNDSTHEFDSKAPVSLSAPPKIGSIPWMKQKAYATLNWGANQLPTVEGAIGGAGGAVLGEVADPLGGGVVGGLAGAGVGGAHGEYDRQRIIDAAGLDPYADPKTKTPGYRTKAMVAEGLKQAGAEVVGMGAGKILRPTLERSLAKLYFAGKLKYGDPLGGGDLENVIHDVMDTEKVNKTPSLGGNTANKAVTVGDLLDTISETKRDVGQQVDIQNALPFKQNGKTVMLGHAYADSTPIVNAITSKATDSPSIVKMAKLNPAGKEAVYLEKIRREALNFQQHPWTYAELTDRRIHLNQELAPIYSLPPGEQRVYLLEHPDLAYKKAEAEAIRDVIYPQMDKASGQPLGTTAALQNKRGALMSLENQVNEHLSNLKTVSRQAQGAPLTQKANISSYGTSSGKPGFAVHRLTSLVHTPNVERQADKKVAQAFGNTIGSKVRGAVSKPFGSEKFGNEILALPLRELVNPTAPSQEKPEDSGTPDDQSSVATPKSLIEKAKQLNPSANGQTSYTHVAVNPVTGHRIGSHSGREWFDVQTGAKVA
jgi:hypothetical protein